MWCNPLKRGHATTLPCWKGRRAIGGNISQNWGRKILGCTHWWVWRTRWKTNCIGVVSFITSTHIVFVMSSWCKLFSATHSPTMCIHGYSMCPFYYCALLICACALLYPHAACTPPMCTPPLCTYAMLHTTHMHVSQRPSLPPLALSHTTHVHTCIPLCTRLTRTHAAMHMHAMHHTPMHTPMCVPIVGYLLPLCRYPQC